MVMETILLIDDEQAVLDGQRNLLRLNGYRKIRTARSGAEAREQLDQEPPALVIVDLTLREESGLDLLRWMREQFPETVVLVVTGASDLKLAVECMRAGAYDFLVKGSDTGRLPGAVRNALEHRNVIKENQRLRDALVRPALQRPEAFEEFITVSDRITRLFHYLEAVAPLRDPILLTGETGVGKEVMARAIHTAGGLTGPFVALNLGGLDDLVISDTLFGHSRGAYTGADGPREGLIRTAAGGTLFLDEFGELSQESQTKLLRLLDSGEFFPLGSDRPDTSRARIILATNRNLEEEVARGGFRRDLYFRVSAHQVRIPPLRERPEDIEPILRHLLTIHSERLGRPPLEPDPALLDKLRQRTLSGNVRELEQLALSALIHGRWNGLREGEALDRPAAAGYATVARTAAPEASDSSEARVGVSGVAVRFGPTLPTPTEVVEELLREADRRNPGNRSDAAAAVGLSPQAFSNRWRRMVGEDG
ncbi:MAG: sigma-54-dependent transcriptional regulator [Spirochaetaceae bacterium]